MAVPFLHASTNILAWTNSRLRLKIEGISDQDIILTVTPASIQRTRCSKIRSRKNVNPTALFVCFHRTKQVYGWVSHFWSYQPPPPGGGGGGGGVGINMIVPPSPPRTFNISVEFKISNFSPPISSYFSIVLKF